ncbi:cytochrome-c oxidase, cbb3-type subunit I, partial [Mesorhizobium sp. M4B.F.Ca.ET.088.02.2.1]
YSFLDTVEAMHPYYIARTFGGLLFLLGAIVGTYNVLMTIRQARLERGVEAGGEVDLPLGRPAALPGE